MYVKVIRTVTTYMSNYKISVLALTTIIVFSTSNSFYYYFD